METFLVKPRWLFLKVHTNAGITGLETTEEHGLAGACCDAWSAPVGDAFKAYEEGTTPTELFRAVIS